MEPVRAVCCRHTAAVICAFSAHTGYVTQLAMMSSPAAIPCVAAKQWLSSAM
ncbi:hypothetical protein [Escherichia coli]|uniref:hypothetical protein n=1 Tax=Escherichia coli TaxID=562 RepID=UPI003CC91B28